MSRLGVVMDHGPSGYFTTQLDFLIFLIQNYIWLELIPFSAQSLSYLGQIGGSFTTLCM